MLLNHLFHQTSFSNVSALCAFMQSSQKHWQARLTHSARGRDRGVVCCCRWRPHGAGTKTMNAYSSSSIRAADTDWPWAACVKCFPDCIRRMCEARWQDKDLFYVMNAMQVLDFSCVFLKACINTFSKLTVANILHCYLNQSAWHLKKWSSKQREKKVFMH